MFTTQQANFMNLILNGGPFPSPFNNSGFASRASLVNNNQGCVPTGGPLADFTADKTSICAGQQVNFTNNTTGNTPISYSWNFQGGSPATSTDPNPTVTYPNPGTYSVTLTATNANGTNQAVKTGYITVAGVSNLPLVEGFENTTFPPSGWTLDNPDTRITWARTTSASGYGQSSASAFYNCYNYSNATNQRDWLITPVLNFSNVTSARLRFDYAYSRYNSSSRDSLHVLYSTDCGSTWNLLWRRGGASLQTTSSFTNTNFQPTSSQWRTDSINLSTGIAGQPSVRFAFVGINNYGNNIYLDNINIFSTTSTTPLPPVADFIGTPTTVTVGNSVSFTDLSSNSPTSWSWTFQGGTPSTSTQQNPIITYNTPGQYNVTLVASNSAGSSSPVTKTAYITVVNPQQGGTGCDTLDNLPADTSVALYAYPFGTGYLSGNNSDRDLAKAERFINNKTVTVNGAFFGLYAKSSSPGNKTVTFAVWSNTGTGGSPGANPIATATYPLSQLLNPNGTFVYIPFANPPSVSSNFYVGVILPTTAGDTVALLTSLANAAYKDSLFAWERYQNGNWVSYATSYTSLGVGFSHLVFPVICSTSVATPPVANFSVNRTNICAGQSVSFKDESSGNPTSWSWQFGSGASPQLSGQRNPTVTFLTPGIYSIRLTVSNNSGSDDTLQTNLITVNPNPNPNVTVEAVRCFGESNGRAKVNVSGNGPFSFSWSDGSKADSIVNKTGGSYTVTITDNNGCTATAIAFIPQPVAPLSVSISVSDALCGQNNGQAEAVASGGNGNYSYIWNNGKTHNPLDSLYSGVYSVTVTDVKGCSAFASQVIDDAPSDLVVTASSQASECGLSNGKAFANAYTGSSSTLSSYAWSNGGTTATISGLPPGDYTVTVTNSLGCTATATTTVKDSTDLIVTIVNKTNPTAPGVSNGTLSAAATGGTGTITFNWSNGATSSTITNLGPGVYSVTATDAKGCRAIATDTLFAPSSIYDKNNSLSVKVFPNPAKDLLWIETNKANGLKMVVFNLFGQKIIEETFKGEQSLHMLNISDLIKGVYYLSVIDNENIVTFAFLKH
ncbi:MAG: PKD domain-containing protein, partial [Chitinophagales bacterium]|nr:PKD domain-containing protein [Chitinophagales bacterium]